jgi:putative membrane protein
MESSICEEHEVNHLTAVRVLAASVALAGLGAATLAVNAQMTDPTTPQAPQGGSMQNPDRVPASDAEFVRALDRANTAELDIAKYVVNRTKDPAVHQFAQHMIDEHSTTAVKLEATTRGTNLAPTPRDDGTAPGVEQRLFAILQADSGAQLDGDFMRMQAPLHRRTLGLLQWESQNGQNNGLKLLATNLIPTEQQHLQLVQNYLAARNLTEYAVPATRPVPGNPNPNGIGTGSGSGSPNNPANPPGASPAP